jgi:hypothetical protein
LPANGSGGAHSNFSNSRRASSSADLPDVRPHRTQDYSLLKGFHLNFLMIHAAGKDSSVRFLVGTLVGGQSFLC